jgi:hypothetical protein
MVFVFDGKHSVFDQESGVTISSKSWTGDRPSRTYRFTFAQKEFSFDFQVAFIKKPEIYKNKVTGKDTDGFAPDKTYIMEDWFSAELLRARKIAGLPKLAPEDYENYRNLIREGMALLTTFGGSISPTPEFSVEFIQNEDVFDALHPPATAHMIMQMTKEASKGRPTRRELFESARETHRQMRSSGAYKKKVYIKRVFASLLLAVEIPVLMPMAWVAERYWDKPAWLDCFKVALAIGIIVSYIGAKKLAKRKFGE